MPWLHQLYTEWKDNLAELVSRHFPGATISEGMGVWKSRKEKSARIEIVTESKNLPLQALAEDIKKLNHQREVLMTESEVLSLHLFVKPVPIIMTTSKFPIPRHLQGDS